MEAKELPERRCRLQTLHSTVSVTTPTHILSTEAPRARVGPVQKLPHTTRAPRTRALQATHVQAGVLLSSDNKHLLVLSPSPSHSPAPPQFTEKAAQNPDAHPAAPPQGPTSAPRKQEVGRYSTLLIAPSSSSLVSFAW